MTLHVPRSEAVSHASIRDGKRIKLPGTHARQFLILLTENLAKALPSRKKGHVWSAACRKTDSGHRNYMQFVAENERHEEKTFHSLVAYQESLLNDATHSRIDVG